MYIRMAERNDVEAISRLYEQFYAYHAKQQPEYYRPVKEGGKYPENVIMGDSGDIFVAEESGEIIGLIHVEEEETAPYPPIVPHRFACVVDFYVQPEQRKKGIGKALLERVKSWAKERRLDYLELFVLEQNLAGRKFYEREGFAPASHTLRYTL